jgi:ribonuclease D
VLKRCSDSKALLLWYQCRAIVKAGVGAKGDATRLRNDYKLVVNGVVCVSELAKSLEPQTTVSLAALARRYLDVTLVKPRALQCGPWSSLPLSDSMQVYAATDAAAGRDVFCKLQLQLGM